MNAIVLAAGAGQRLPQAKIYGSKLLVPVRGKTILERNLLFLKRAGIRKCILTLCSGKEKVVAFLEAKRSFGLRIAFSYEDRLLGTAGGVKKVQGLLGDQDFLVFYGDNLSDFDIQKLWRVHRQNKAIGTIGVFDPKKARHSGVLAGLLELDAQGRVEKFAEKRNNQKTPEKGYVNAGIAVFSPKIFREIPARRVCDLARDIYPKLLKKKQKLFAVEGASYVLASDTPETLRRTRHFFAKNRL